MGGYTGNGLDIANPITHILSMPAPCHGSLGSTQQLSDMCLPASVRPADEGCIVTGVGPSLVTFTASANQSYVVILSRWLSADVQPLPGQTEQIRLRTRGEQTDAISWCSLP